jgi:RimJ/RimL family protein N-acetyltransferase
MFFTNHSDNTAGVYMLKGKNIYLRTIAEKDIQEFLKLNDDLELRGDYFQLDILTEPSFRKWYNETGLWNDDFGRMLIFDHNHKMIGYINYFKTICYFDAYEIGYIIYKKEYCGKGYTTEAVKLLCDYLFKAKKITRLEIRCSNENVASKRVAEKSGFVHEGTSKSAFRRAGKLYDSEVYALTIEEWEKWLQK